MTNGGVRGRREHLDVVGAQLDVAGRRASGSRVPGRRVGDRCRWTRDHELAADGRGDRVRLRRLLRVDDDLGDAVAVAQVEEDELAQVATAVDPAGERDRAADVLGAGVGAGQVAVGGRRHGPPMVAARSARRAAVRRACGPGDVDARERRRRARARHRRAASGDGASPRRTIARSDGQDRLHEQDERRRDRRQPRQRDGERGCPRTTWATSGHARGARRGPASVGTRSSSPVTDAGQRTRTAAQAIVASKIGPAARVEVAALADEQQVRRVRRRDAEPEERAERPGRCRTRRRRGRPR